MNPISFAIAKCFVKIKYISLANIIMDKHIFKELLQRDCTAQTIFSEIRRLTLDKEERDTMIRDYEKLKVVLGGEGSSDKIAESMVSILKK
jgi:lipid-A-disaccharide synthase